MARALGMGVLRRLFQAKINAIRTMSEDRMPLFSYALHLELDFISGATWKRANVKNDKRWMPDTGIRLQSYTWNCAAAPPMRDLFVRDVFIFIFSSHSHTSISHKPAFNAKYKGLQFSLWICAQTCLVYIIRMSMHVTHARTHTIGEQNYNLFLLGNETATHAMPLKLRRLTWVYICQNF